MEKSGFVLLKRFWSQKEKSFLYGSESADSCWWCKRSQSYSRSKSVWYLGVASDISSVKRLTKDLHTASNSWLNIFSHSLNRCVIKPKLKTDFINSGHHHKQFHFFFPFSVSKDKTGNSDETRRAVCGVNVHVCVQRIRLCVCAPQGLCALWSR